MPNRDIIEADALPWLAEHGAQPGASVVTSLPDADEIGMKPLDWQEWFALAIEASICAADPALPAIFYQTGRKHEGQLISKSAPIIEAAKRCRAKLLWHKIALRRELGGIDIHRPGFTHMIACSIDCPPGKASPDCFMRGKQVYPNGIGIAAASLAIGFAIRAGAKLILDPFCGRGTIPALANAMGVDAIGIDIDPTQCAHARALRINARA